MAIWRPVSGSGIPVRRTYVDARHHSRLHGEPRGSVCEWEGDKLNVWLSTQGVHGSAAVCRWPRHPQTNVQVITQAYGGGFGSKSQSRCSNVICAGLGKGSQSAREMFIDGRKSISTAETGPRATPASKPGSPQTVGLRRGKVRHGERAEPAPARISRCPTSTMFPIDAEATETFIPIQDSAAHARPGPSSGKLPHGILMDELADLVKIDPLEFRIKNCPPLAANAMWRSYLAEGGRAVRLG